MFLEKDEKVDVLFSQKNYSEIVNFYRKNKNYDFSIASLSKIVFSFSRENKNDDILEIYKSLHDMDNIQYQSIEVGLIYKSVLLANLGKRKFIAALSLIHKYTKNGGNELDIVSQVENIQNILISRIMKKLRFFVLYPLTAFILTILLIEVVAGVSLFSAWLNLSLSIFLIVFALIYYYTKYFENIILFLIKNATSDNE